jgi:NADPH-dependent 2,4-dienoyl-CoA reductase/sulfur reductase-like enzyme
VTAEHAGVVVVGGGPAGAKAVEALREQGFAGALTLVAQEPFLPYERPLLSKGYLAGDLSFDAAVVHPAGWYAARGVDLRLGTTAYAIDRDAHRVALSDGASLPYAKLVLATGSAPRRLTNPGARSAGVHYLRTRADADAIRATFGTGRRLLVIGGGWIGLEAAAAARKTGTEVTVVDNADLPLLGVLGPELAPVFADLHRDHGVTLHLGTAVEDITVAGGTASGACLDDGTVVDADAVLIGVGAIPEVTLAATAGLAVDDGVLVDASLRSSDPDIYAVGDIANHDHPVLKTRVRVEHWAAAVNQPAVMAASLLGRHAEYADLPYMFTDQYDLGMEYLGHAPPGTYARIVIRGDPAAHTFVAFWLDPFDRVKAVMTVNVRGAIDQVRPLILAGSPVDPARLADPDVHYADLAEDAHSTDEGDTS